MLMNNMIINEQYDNVHHHSILMDGIQHIIGVHGGMIRVCECLCIAVAEIH